MLRNNKGITLIALVITIIVLLILAGVSIAMLTGENGVLTQAKNARTDSEKAGISDKVNMAIQAAYTKHLSTTNGGTITDLPVTEIQTQYNTDNQGTSTISISGTTATVTEGSKTYKVTLTKTGHSYTTNKDAVTINK